MKLEVAEKIADGICEELRREGVCKLAEVAGSVRRQKAEVKDIELVLIPRLGMDLFGEENPSGPTRFDDWLRDEVEVAGALLRGKKDGPRHKQLIHANTGVTIEFFIVLPPAQFGAIYTIRTGPAAFSQWLVTKKKYGGGMPNYLQQKDGALWYKGEIVETPTELHYFEALGLDWVPVCEREAFVKERLK